jgi:hypothetical protein
VGGALGASQVGDEGETVAVEALVDDALGGGPATLDVLDQLTLALLVVDLCVVVGDHDDRPLGDVSFFDITYIPR